MSDLTTSTTLNQDATLLENLAYAHQKFLGILDSISSGTGGDTTTSNIPSLTAKRPWLEEPEGSISYDEYGTLAALPPAPSVATTVLQFQVPDGMDGVINYYSVNFGGGGFSEGTGTIVWQILRNGAAIRNYDNITSERGTTAIPRRISPIRLWSKDIISVVVTHVSDNTLNGQVLASCVGYYYPSKG